jgi:hypothetical protein
MGSCADFARFTPNIAFSSQWLAQWRLADANVADGLSFVRSNWGNQAEAVSPPQVAKARNALTAQL